MLFLWGETSQSTTTTGVHVSTIDFPHSFKDLTYSVTATLQDVGRGYSIITTAVAVGSKYTNKMTLNAIIEKSYPGDTFIYWIAIGTWK